MEPSRTSAGAPMVDALAKLEMAMRPQSVPSWLSSDTNHAPKVTALGPRRSAVEYMETASTRMPSAKDNASAPAALASIHESAAGVTTSTGPSASCVRPRAPIMVQKDPTGEAKAFLSKESLLGMPKRNRHRVRTQQQTSDSSSSTTRRVKQSLTESLRSLEFFDKTNRSRELSAKYSVMRTQADPEGNVHFVNIDDETADDDDHDHYDTSVVASPRSLEHGVASSSPHSIAAAPVKANSLNTTKIPSPDTALQAATTDMFRIPELPFGQHLVINILSTWGDPFYVGLMGVELFDHTGHAVHVADVDKQLSADPPDLNAVDHDRVDPRTVDKLMDGCYFTNDELHAWLAPFTRGQNHYVYVDFDYALSLSMIRIWNYNTTRIHSYRGARYVEISLDGKTIFKGEISRAPGSVTADVEACHECILFTTNSNILRLIEKYEKPTSKATDTSSSVANESPLQQSEERPKTGNRANRSGGLGTGGSPAVFPLSSVPKPSKPAALSLVTHSAASSRPCTAPIVCDASSDKPVACQRIEVVFEANWGDPYDVGLAGIQFLDNNYSPVKTDAVRVIAPHAQATAERLVATHGARHLSTNGDEMWHAPLEAVLGGVAPSSSPTAGNRQGALVVDFGHIVMLRALKVWNYNTTLEESFKGAKQISIYIDGARHSQFSLRKAPGNIMAFDFGQFLYLKAAQPVHHSLGSSAISPVAPHSPIATADVLSIHSPVKPDIVRREEDTSTSSHQESSRDRWHSSPAPRHPAPMKPIAEAFQQYQTPLFPTGYIVKFVFLSTWGDTYYLGLNGLELYDRDNNLVELSDHMIDAQPRDINILKDPGAPHDVRTLDKLYDGVNSTYDDSHMWLAPFTPSQHNKLVLFFNEPVTLSRIRLWNYSKTPSRGVREFEVFMDDQLIFHGVLKQAPPLQLTSQDEHEYELMRLTTDVGENRRLRKRRHDRAEAAAAAAGMTQAVLFTDDAEVVEAETPHIYLPEGELEESVTFYDNSQVLSLSDTPQRAQAARPMTSAGGGVGGRVCR